MIPYGRQAIDEDDIEAVVRSLRSDWLTQGPAIELFESSLARQCQASFAIACNSGTAALHMAFASAGIGPGDKVIVPANTFLATANAAIYLGAEVRFCDVDPISGLMTEETLSAIASADVRAIVPVHFAGQACDMRSIVRLRDQKFPEAVLIEDASHAIGGVYSDGSPVGRCRYSSMITFSFHPVKTIAAGEGGAVSTDCPILSQKMQKFRCHGMTKEPAELGRSDEGSWYYEMHEPGFNYRIPEMSCALAASQLTKLDRFIERRREIATRYSEAFADLPEVTLPVLSTLHTSAWHLYCVHIAFDQLGIDRQFLMRELLEKGIGTQVHYFPVSLQPFYEKRYQASESQFPGAIEHYQRALSLPMYPAMSDHDVEKVIDEFSRAILCSHSTSRFSSTSKLV